jgi:hypothetical protein
MNSFADLRKISSYSNALAEKLTSSWFADRTSITGQEIKKFTEVEQINFFILKNLFDKWQDETSRLRSPYFNYETSEVQQAIKNLMNALSNQIQVSKEFFKPLLTRSIEECLTLAADPIEYFRSQFRAHPSVPLEKIRQLQKFQKINLHYLKSISDLYDENQTEIISADIILDRLERSGLRPEDHTEITEKLSSLLTIETKQATLEPEISLHISKFSPTEEQTSEAKESEDTFSLPAVSFPKEIVWNKPEPVTDIPQEISQREQSEKTPVLNTPDTSFLGSLIASKKEDAPLFQQKITDLRTAIPLSDKFLFIRELFNDEPSGLAETLQGLEKCRSLDEAVSFLEVNCLVKYKWTRENPYLAQFMQLIDKRFS